MGTKLAWLAAMAALGVSTIAQADPPPWTQAALGQAAWQGSQFVYGSGEGLAISRQAYATLINFVLAEQKLPRSSWRSVVLDRDAMARQTTCAGDAACELANPVFTTCSPQSQPTVIFDADETLLLNLGQEYAAVALGQAYTPSRWQQWERDDARKGAAGRVVAVPGAKEALEILRRAGVAVIVVTNRDATALQREPSDPADFADYTIAALQQAGLGTFRHKSPDQDLYLAVEEGDKGSGKDQRRRTIAANHCVLAMAGDQLGDFSDLFADAKFNPATRRGAADNGPIGDLWGQGWFVLPNPIYGTAVPNPGDIDNVFPPSSHWSDPTKP